MQWLDDFEDIVLGLFQMLERLRWPCMRVAIAAGCALAVRGVAGPAGDRWPALAWLALAGIGLWAAGRAARELRGWLLPADLGEPRRLKS